MSPSKKPTSSIEKLAADVPQQYREGFTNAKMAELAGQEDKPAEEEQIKPKHAKDKKEGADEPK